MRRMRGAWRAGLIGLAAAVIAGPTACAPWHAAGTSRSLDGGAWEAGAGFSWLAPQSFRIWEGFPAPQFWVARGLGADTEVRLTYAPPLSLDTRLKWQITDGRNGVALYGGGGWISYGGVLDVPLSGLPYGTFGATVSRHPEADGARPDDAGARVPFATVGAKIPFVRHEHDRTAVAIWVTGSVGLEWESDDLWIAPQLGWIAPVGQWNRWIWSPGVAAGVRR